MSTVEASERSVMPTYRVIGKRAGRDPDLIRGLDITFALIALVLLSPVLALIALGVRAQDGGAAVFRQQRIGRDGRMFDCLKFRSMRIDAESRLSALVGGEWNTARKLRNDPRVTRFGRILRTTSLDELPQLINVLRGEMSLVGPRPIVVDETMRYGRRLADYCAVRPGLTGLWQVSGRNDVPYPRRVAMDVWLVRNLTVRVYLAILAHTIPAVLSRKGVY